MDSYYNIADLQDSLIPMADALYGGDWILLQNNALVHHSVKNTDFLDGNKIEVMSWPAKSNDPNIIEIFLGSTREVYLQGGSSVLTVF